MVKEKEFFEEERIAREAEEEDRNEEDELVENDEMSPEEAGFLRGYREANKFDKEKEAREEET